MTVNTIFDRLMQFLAAQPGVFPDFDGGYVYAFALGVTAFGSLPASVRTGFRRWHGSIDDQFDAIDNVVTLATSHPLWGMPSALLEELTAYRDRLRELISRCRSTSGSPADRVTRNALLKTTVGLCLLQVKVWAHAQFIAGVLTSDDVHLLGFLLPGENGGSHLRAEATDVTAEVKTRVINEDFVRVVIDQSGGENAALVVHGWPHGVRNALIVITAADGHTEVVRKMTNHLHTDIRMPEGSRGQSFLIKAAFLRHVTDEPRFGNEPSFTMPRSTADLLAILDRQHHEDFEEQVREVERHRQEIERLHAEAEGSSK
jgi:hypothetical protein